MATITNHRKQGNELPKDVISLLCSDRTGKRARRVAKALEGKCPEEQWSTWTSYLARREKPVPLRKLVIGRPDGSPLLWAAHEADAADRETVQLIEQLGELKRPKQRPTPDQQLEQHLTFWLAEADECPGQPTYGLQALAWAHALPRLVARVPLALWWDLVSHLSDAAKLVQHAQASHRPLVQQLLAGELPVTLRYVLPELEVCRQWAPSGLETLSGGMVELLDGAGLPHCRHLPLLRPLLACWTRAGLLVARIKGLRLSPAARHQFAYLLENTLRLTRPDGSQVFSANSAAQHGLSANLVRSALALADDPECTALAQSVFPKAKTISKADLSDDLPDCPSGNSAWSALAVLRADWSSASPRLTVAYADRAVDMELTSGETIVWSGRCQPEVEIDGVDLQPDSDWEEICWFTDDEVDYLELEIKLDGGWCVQRQIALAREDRFLYVADAVLGPSPAKMQYRCVWPLHGPVQFDAAKETHEGFLAARRRLALALPLALPEWRDGRPSGQLDSTARGMQLQQSAHGQRLYAPVFFDLDRHRMRKTVTWRQLTIGEQLKIVPREEAVGYRVQAADEQWLIYRSLTPPTHRTVLGQHISSECIIARFDEEGEADPMVEVEPD